MSKLPTQTEIENLQTDWDDWLFDVCTILRQTTVQDEYGEHEEEVIVQEDVPCNMSLSVLPGVEAQIAQQQTRVADATISLPYGTDIKINDTIELTSQGDRRFEVTYVPAPSDFASGQQVYAREVQSGN